MASGPIGNTRILILRPAIWLAVEARPILRRALPRLLCLTTLLCATAALQPQPATETTIRRRPHTPHQGWYDIVREDGHLRFFSFSRDGYRLPLWLLPTRQSKAPLLLLIPDVYQQDPAAMVAILQQLRKQAHLLIVYPRGQQPAAQLYSGEKPDYHKLTRNLKQSQLYWRDYAAALSRVRELQSALGVEPTRYCVLAGDFHSNVLLQQQTNGIDCAILLTPERSFYQLNLARLVHAETKLPLLILSNPYQAPRLDALQKRLPGARLLIGERSGSGMRLLYRNPTLLESIQAFVQNEPPAEKTGDTQTP